MESFWREFFLRVFWYGGSTFDAWLNLASTRLSGRILTLPNATAEMGLPFAIVLLLLQFAMGYWASCIVNVLYLKHIRSLDANASSRRHSVQLHEIIGGLLGRRWFAVSAFFNTASLFTISALQLLACSNLVFFMEDKLNKRTWVFIFGAIFSVSVFVPTAHNYRVWSFVGVITTVFSSFYLSIAPFFYRKEVKVTYTSPHSYTEFFSGVSGFIYFGHNAVLVEIMDAMWKPQEFGTVYFYSIIYMLIFGMVPTVIIYRMYGDETTTYSSALKLLPRSKWRDTTVVLFLLHQMVVFGIFVLGMYFIWEKVVRVHGSSSYLKRTLSRVPIFLAIWLAALAFPFYGVINRVVDSTVVVFNFYVLPCAAYNATFWSPSSRRGQRPFSRVSWVVDFSINLGIILWVVIVESGLGLWSGLHIFEDSKSYKLFAKCFGC